ncbi:winged helix-turn-helix domain-containing protein [Caulobacter sp. 602-1]|uniref:winged helix-turn-helix domain-containing protein n=1 Tax=Caulobacter sp. 602-1 TaxID=2492472 RepID=UPI000F62FD75|nr:winged helix-turn-helix domain-containing protein [Caulobacter sp. 602-1]RRN63853.1 hypothetical protein EIK80_13875 [Caulobacter sp. 602-1]
MSVPCAPFFPQTTPPAWIAFGPFEIRPNARALLRHGVPIPIGGRALDLLLTLARAPGSVVLKEDLMRGVWPLMIVEEANLRAQLRYLRRALGDHAWRVKTVPGRGYLLNLAEAPRPRATIARPPVVMTADPEAVAALRGLRALVQKPSATDGWSSIRGAAGASAMVMVWRAPAQV